MKKLFVIPSSVFLIATFFLSPSFSDIQPQEHNKATKLKVMNSYGNIPLSFIQNTGQLNRMVRYYLKGGRGNIYFTKGGIAYNLLSGDAPPSSNKSRLNNLKRLSFTLRPMGANKNVRLLSLNKLPGKVNYFTGNNPKNWHTDIPTYKEIVYKNIYNGIDMKIYGNYNQMEYDFIVSPGADPSDIAMLFEGIDALSVDEDGNLLIKTSFGELRHMKPLAYQEIDGRRCTVEGSFIVSKNNFSFHIGDYNKNYPLIIDPLTSSYSTHLGGNSSDYGRSVAVDASGNAYVTGSTTSDNFPTANAYQETGSGVFVTKLSPGGDTLIYSTYLGGSGLDYSYGIAVDASGSVYVAGWTYSNDFPIKNAFQETRHGRDDAFVTKLSPSGDSLSFSTYLGGNASDMGNSIAVDSSKCAYVTGVTHSDDFPTQNAFQDAHGGSSNAFVTKFNQGGDTVAYSTYIGGTSLNGGKGIAVDVSGSAYVTGYAFQDFPAQNAFQSAFGGGYGDAFVIKLSSSGSTLSYSTYLGGSSGDEGYGIAVDASGSAYVTGGTDSDNFPTQNAFQGTSGGGTGTSFNHVDAFVTKLSPNGDSLAYSTYLGGIDTECGNAIAVDASGSAYVTGETYSANFPIKGEYQGTLRGYSDAFYSKLDSNGDALASSTYLGGNSWDEGSGIAVDESGNVYLTGHTDSEDFPAKNAFQVISGGGRDAFIAKLTEREKQIWYVDSDVTSSGDGQGWSEAFKTIQEAMDAASGGDEIWVKKGTYNLSSQINVDKAVGIYGGFSGGETKRDERNPSTNVTKIDGKSSVYHCFYATSDATLDGLTITGGNSDGSWPDNSGGGIFIDKSSPVINNCIISENSAAFGGGIFNSNCTTTIISCTITKNIAETSGGGMYNSSSSSAITNSIISENSASFGGGLYNQKSSPTITNCTISGNTATGGGGGIRNKESSSPTINNCVLWENTANDGPQIYNDESSSPAITYCNIQDGYEGQGNINNDPLFTDSSSNDLHLKATSPCIDKGNNNALNLPDNDFEGDGRILDGNNDGIANVDMGVDEYVFIDTDSDGLPDDWEITYFGDLSQSSNGDYDEDKKTNFEEYQAGSDPTSKPDGDVAPFGNRDGKVNVGDALVTLRFALGLEAPTQEDMGHGDVAPLDASGQPSPDGVINVGDALVILRKALGIIEF